MVSFRSRMGRVQECRSFIGWGDYQGFHTVLGWGKYKGVI